MNFNIIDTQSAYRRLLNEHHSGTRETIFREELVAPYTRLVEIFGRGIDSLAMFQQWGMTLAQFEEANREKTCVLIETLAAHDAWNKFAQALEEGRNAFVPYMDRISLDTIQAGLFIADMSNAPGPQRGYTGFGGIPGYIMTVYGEVNDYNIERIKGATVHELHHNILGAVWKEQSMISSLAAYIVGEGLAESFAGELYGEKVVGFYVTDFDEARLDETKHLIYDALDISDFNAMRAYIFGDMTADHMNLPKTGVPAFAGYAIGYRVVQAYLKRSGKTVVETTFVPAREIIAESQFFD